MRLVGSEGGARAAPRLQVGVNAPGTANITTLGDAARA